MKMVNIVGEIDDVDNFIVDILSSNTAHLVNAEEEIENFNFTFNLDNEEGLKRTIELNDVISFPKDEKNQEAVDKAHEIMNFLGIKKIDNSSYDLKLDYNSFYDEISEKVQRYRKIDEELDKIKKIEDNYDMFKDLNIDLSDLANLEYFTARFGILGKKERLKIKKNYGNILAMIFHITTIDEKEVYLALYPNEVANEVDRILKSVYWEDVDILGGHRGTAQEILAAYQNDEKKLLAEKKELDKYKDELLNQKKPYIEKILSSMLARESLSEVKNKMARSNDFFYFSAWVGTSDLDKIKAICNKYDNTVVSILSPDRSKMTPPTKMKNNAFFKPFEMLVNMYGAPNYREVDPTPFLGLTYMLLFGAMFGDLGQGFVFFLLGLLLKNKGSKEAGGIATRIGASSMIFGLLYGSVFGNEHLIPALFMRPFEEINTALMYAVGLGVVLVTIAFIIGIYNKLKNKDIEEGIFGKEGLSGLLLFVSFVLIALNIFGIKLLPMKAIIAIIIACFAMILFKRPLRQLIQKEKISYENNEKGSYYVESGFSLLEAALSTLSNLISFIRVGAFAINHVGLFMAFQTIGKMLNNPAGNFLSLLAGNIIILVLEGLIVMIQGLRLEYYELFSKYYEGDGFIFEANKLKSKEN